jgi:fibronectin-binding autotransporter adhesin
MNQAHTTRFSTRLRLLCGLALFLGLCIMLGGLARPAHAQSTLSVSDCSSDTQLQADVTQANSDNAGDVITFACSGVLKLTSTLSINGSMTLSGGEQRVTLDGGGSLQVLHVGNVTFTLNALTIAHGSALFGEGSGLENSGRVSISNSTFAYNSASDRGGGLWNAGSGTVTISNSTLANNSASEGGGLENWGTATISNSTVAYNSGAGLVNVVYTISISGSIVANNTDGDCASAGGSYVDNGYNLGCFNATNPKLDPNGLQNNGGPTQTLALEPDSAAVDQIPVGSSCPATDQRGVSRPQGPACDIGAFEMTAADGVTVMIHVVNSFHLSSSLQHALDAKLQDVLAAITAGQTATACSELTDFIGYVQSNIGKGLTADQATQLVNEATVIKTRLGC